MDRLQRRSGPPGPVQSVQAATRPYLLPRSRLGVHRDRRLSESSESDEAEDELDVPGERQKLASETILGDPASCCALLVNRTYLADATDDPTPGVAALDGSKIGGPNDIGERFESLCDAPLHSAAREGGVEMTRLLLAAGADLGSLNVDRATPGHVAALCGHAAVLTLLLGADCTHVDRADADHWTPLHHASYHGHAECVQLLLQHGAAPDARDSHTLTPLHHAASVGHSECARCLLQAEQRLMALHDEFLDTPVIAAVRNGHVAVVDEFLSAGLDVNSTDAFETTLLQIAAFHGQHMMLQHLLLEDASVEGGATCKSRLLALHLAAMSGHEQCLTALLDAGAEPSAVGGVDTDGMGRAQRRTALHFAAEAGHAQCVSILLEHGADAEAKDFQQHTARELAALESHQLVSKAFDVHTAGDRTDFEPQLQKLSESGKGTIVPKAGGRAQARREGRSFGPVTLAEEAAESKQSVLAIRSGKVR